jgi:hypothetical protein
LALNGTTSDLDAYLTRNSRNGGRPTRPRSGVTPEHWPKPARHASGKDAHPALVAGWRLARC